MVQIHAKNSVKAGISLHTTYTTRTDEPTKNEVTKKKNISIIRKKYLGENTIRGLGVTASLTRQLATHYFIKYDNKIDLESLPSTSI